MTQTRSIAPGRSQFRQLASRHRKKLLAWVAVVSLLTIAAVLYWPRKYVSESKLFVRVGRESVALDPTASMAGKMVGFQASRTHEIQSVLDMLASRAMLSKVVDEIGVEELQVNPQENWLTRAWDEVSAAKTRLAALLGTSESAAASGLAHEEAVDSLRENVKISAPENSAVINIKCAALSPDQAQRIVKTLTDVYLSEHVRLNRTAGSESFFEDQTSQAAEQLEISNRKLQDAKDEMAIVSIEGELALLEAQKTENETGSLKVSSDLAESRAAHQALTRAVGELEKVVLLERNSRASQASDQMRSELYKLELRERQLSTTHTDEHPLLKAVRSQLREARKIEESEAEFRDEEKFAVDPNRQNLELDLAREGVRLASFEARHQALTAQHDTLVQRIKDVNAYAIRLEVLQREIDLLAKSHQTYSDSLEKARVDSELGQQHITNVNVVQDATLVHKPASPQTTLVLVGGLLMGLCGSVVLVIVAEGFDWTLSSTEPPASANSMPAPPPSQVPAPSQVSAPSPVPAPNSLPAASAQPSPGRVLAPSAVTPSPVTSSSASELEREPAQATG